MQGDIKNRMSTVTLQLSKLNFTQVAVPNAIDKVAFKNRCNNYYSPLDGHSSNSNFYSCKHTFNDDFPKSSRTN